MSTKKVKQKLPETILEPISLKTAAGLADWFNFKEFSSTKYWFKKKLVR